MPKLDTMLSVMDKCHNHFLYTEGVNSGEFIITGGVITPSIEFYPNQYVWVQGSVLNDGLYQADGTGALTGLTDEPLTGYIFALRVPKLFLELCDHIEKFEADKASRPAGLQSEKVFDYSWTAATTATGASITWEMQFASELPYRNVGSEFIDVGVIL